MNSTTLFALIICNIAWSLNPTVGKWLLEDLQPLQVAALRYSTGWITVLPILLYRLKSNRQNIFWQSKSVSTYIFIIAIALLTFTLSPVLQFLGLKQSRATDTALIIALEPLVTVLIAR